MENRPVVKLLGEDGNVFNIIGLCKTAAKKAGWSSEQVADLQRRMMGSGSYDAVLQIALEEFEVE